MGDEGCCLGKEVQETSCFGFFPQTVSMFCLKMITFETHNYFLEKGSFLSRVLESFQIPSGLCKTRLPSSRGRKPQEEDQRCHQQRLPVCVQEPSWVFEFPLQPLGVGYLSVIVPNK